jgi:hypothetical protein
MNNGPKTYCDEDLTVEEREAWEIYALNIRELGVIPKQWTELPKGTQALWMYIRNKAVEIASKKYQGKSIDLAAKNFELGCKLNGAETAIDALKAELLKTKNELSTALAERADWEYLESDSSQAADRWKNTALEIALAGGKLKQELASLKEELNKTKVYSETWRFLGNDSSRQLEELIKENDDLERSLESRDSVILQMLEYGIELVAKLDSTEAELLEAQESIREWKRLEEKACQGGEIWRSASMKVGEELAQKNKEIQLLINAPAKLELLEKIAQLETQLAGCSVAALGWAQGDNDCKQGDWGWSVAFDDVKKLRARCEEAETQAKTLKLQLEACDQAAQGLDFFITSCDKDWSPVFDHTFLLRVYSQDLEKKNKEQAETINKLTEKNSSLMRKYRQAEDSFNTLSNNIPYPNVGYAVSFARPVESLGECNGQPLTWGRGKVLPQTTLVAGYLRVVNLESDDGLTQVCYPISTLGILWKFV